MRRNYLSWVFEGSIGVGCASKGWAFQEEERTSTKSQSCTRPRPVLGMVRSLLGPGTWALGEEVADEESTDPWGQ